MNEDVGPDEAAPVAKHPGGRPTLYRDEYPEQARRFCMLKGATNAELAAFFEVSEDTIHEWRHVHPKFSDAVKAGKESADANVAQSLYDRAMGYEHEAVKILSTPNGIVEVPYVERYPPDATSMIFWLKNRQPRKWRDKQDVEHTGADGAPLVPVGAVQITLVPPVARDGPTDA